MQAIIHLTLLHQINARVRGNQAPVAVVGEGLLSGCLIQIVYSSDPDDQADALQGYQHQLVGCHHLPEQLLAQLLGQALCIHLQQQNDSMELWEKMTF